MVGLLIADYRNNDFSPAANAGPLAPPGAGNADTMQTPASVRVQTNVGRQKKMQARKTNVQSLLETAPSTPTQVTSPTWTIF